MSVIHILCNDGSPLGCSSRTIYGDSKRLGVGGAELGLITMCEGFTKRGHSVILFNDPWEANASPFEQRAVRSFDVNEKRDFLIIFRSPNSKSIPVNNCKKIWWSCDQYTQGSFSHFYPTVNQTVVISPFHAQHFLQQYGIKKVTITDLPVRTWEYEQDVERIKHKFLFASVPDRGLEVLWRIWPKIKQEIPDACLSITSDYRLWGAATPMNEKYKIRWAAYKDFKFLGAINRKDLIREQLSSDILCYPSTYYELFGIAVSEAQVAGCYPITTSIGALETTNMGTVVKWNANDLRGDGLFVQALLETLNDPNYEKRRKDLQKKAIERFNLDTILDYWEREILT